jgi:alpha-galactosidase
MVARAQKVCRWRAGRMAVVAYAALLYCVSVIDRTPAAGTHGNLWEHQVQSQANQMRTDTATAIRFVGATDAKGFPVDSAWEIAAPIRFDTDWQGLNGDPERATQVRLMWTAETLFLRFDAKYQALTVFADDDIEGRRDHLWDRDVCEAFLQPDPSQFRRYKELEVAPNGFFIDLDIDAGAGSGRDLSSGLRRRVDSASKTWRAVLAVPMKAFVERFDPKATWRANFYRVEGPAEPRFYAAWQPTRTEKPSFHVPEAFGRLVFAESAAR